MRYRALRETRAPTVVVGIVFDRSSLVLKKVSKCVLGMRAHPG
jgi:hypothetical protein